MLLSQNMAQGCFLMVHESRLMHSRCKISWPYCHSPFGAQPTKKKNLVLGSRCYGLQHTTPWHECQVAGLKVCCILKGPLVVIVDLGVIAMKGYLKLSGSPELDPCYLTQFRVIPRTPLLGEKTVHQWSGRTEFYPRSSHTKDSKNDTWCCLA